MTFFRLPARVSSTTHLVREVALRPSLLSSKYRNYSFESTPRMERSFWILLLTLQLVTLFPLQHSSATSDPLEPAFRLVRQAVEESKIPGAIALVARDGKILRHEAS